MKWSAKIIHVCTICLCALSFLKCRMLQSAMRTWIHSRQDHSLPSTASTCSLTSRRRNSEVGWSFQSVWGGRGRVLLGSFTAVRRVSWVKMYFHLFISPVARLIWLSAHTLSPHALICFIHLLVQICFELHLFPTDLYLRVSADKAPLFTGLKTEGLPASFDWRDKGAVAPVHNQQAVRLYRQRLR